MTVHTARGHRQLPFLEDQVARREPTNSLGLPSTLLKTTASEAEVVAAISKVAVVPVPLTTGHPRHHRMEPVLATLPTSLPHPLLPNTTATLPPRRLPMVPA